jgi:hypothetical protein
VDPVAQRFAESLLDEPVRQRPHQLDISGRQLLAGGRRVAGFDRDDREVGVESGAVRRRPWVDGRLDGTRDAESVLADGSDVWVTADESDRVFASEQSADEAPERAGTEISIVAHSAVDSDVGYGRRKRGRHV